MGWGEGGLGEVWVGCSEGGLGEVWVGWGVDGVGWGEVRVWVV